MLDKIKAQLFRPVDIASLVFFRVAFGFIMLVEVKRYFANGWIERYFVKPTFFFKYYGFGWVEPWSGDGMYWHFVLLGVTASLIMIGLFYRLAAIAFFFLFSYIFLLDQTHYLNHFYFVILLSGLLCVAPAHRALSVDSRLFPKIRSDSIPAWVLLMFILQMEVMYLYAGIVKINPDWLRLQPLEMWLAPSADLPLIGPLMTEKWTVAVAAYGSILLHLIGAPLLLFKRTRLWVFLLYACFHFMNHTLFKIGIFPWLTLAGTTLFFDPDWPRRLWHKLRILMARDVRNPVVVKPYAAVEPAADTHSRPKPASQTLIVSLLGVWLAAQVLVPLRHLLYPGSPSWTEEGHRFAWQMKLRDKVGRVAFFVTDPESGEPRFVPTRPHLNRRQSKSMACKPDMILQFAHFIADREAAASGVRPAVTVQTHCALNGRRAQALIDPEVDLAAITRDLRHADWILPLTEPLR